MGFPLNNWCKLSLRAGDYVLIWILVHFPEERSGERKSEADSGIRFLLCNVTCLV